MHSTDSLFKLSHQGTDNARFDEYAEGAVHISQITLKASQVEKCSIHRREEGKGNREQTMPGSMSTLKALYTLAR